ncbi:MAG: hypothetical protein WAV48_01965, partial [Candidatus Magasanikiibacteriota bacterium]
VQGCIDAGECRLEVVEPLLAIVALLGNKKLGQNYHKVASGALAGMALDPILLRDLLTKAQANADKMAAALAAQAAKPAEAAAK